MPDVATSTEPYTVACPDVLEVPSNASGTTRRRITVDPDGTISVDASNRIRVDGMSLDEISIVLAKELETPSERIQVKVAEYSSRHIYLCGPVAGSERSLAFMGPETVVDFLRRSGALTWEAEPRDVHVVRSNVADGRRPEVFPVDLNAILAKGDGQTNIRLRPNDQVYVGETRQARWAKQLPPWLQFNRPLNSSSSAGP